MPDTKPATVTKSAGAGPEGFIRALSAAGFIGDVETSYASRLVVATDNSIYQQLPQAVLHPRTRADVACLARVAKKFPDIRFAPRGGGTGTNGQSLTSWIVIDFSRHLRNVLELNLKEQWVRVEAGMVKDALNDLLKPHGYFFAPDTSTSNRATIGGMIATDASGQGSLVYGKTSDHVLSLSGYTADGHHFETEPLSIAQAKAKAAESNWLGSVYAQLLDTCLNHQDEIEARFPPLNRYLTGYDLRHAVDTEAGIVDLAKVITGSEGTLALVTEAKLRITPLPRYKVLINVKYLDFQAALEHAPALVNAKATSVETIDSNVLNLARKDIVWHEVRDLLTDVPPHRMNGINMVEFNGHTRDEVKKLTEQLVEQLKADIETDSGVIGYQVCTDPESIQRVYKMRKKAVGLLAGTSGAEKPVAFVEDTAVPPEKLADYIREFRQLLDSCGLQYGMFGHVDAGVLHVRPALDLTDENQEYLIRALSDAVVALTARYGGLMWGEHGKGYRSEYGPEFFGERLFAELRKIKSVFDPHNRLNPGKICTPLESTESLVSVESPMRGQFDRQIPAGVRDSWAPVLNCNGNGLCFNYKPDSPMCPSYRATSDRKQSPKGRAGLLREWLRLRAATANKTATSSDRALLDSLEPEIYQSLDTCLSCKACSVQCPVHVDIPSHKSLFLSDYFRRNRRPLKDHFVKRSESLLSGLGRVPGIANLLTRNSLSESLNEHVVGYCDVPRFSVPSARKRIKKLDVLTYQQFQTEYRKTYRGQHSPDEAGYVFIVDDTYTSVFNADLIEDTARVLLLLGKTPVWINHVRVGKAEHVKGFIDSFTATARKSAELLQHIHETYGFPMIGLDAATTLCFRDEYLQVLTDQERGDFSVQLLSEWMQQPEILRELSAFVQDSEDNPDGRGSSEPRRYNLLPHCTEQTAIPEVKSHWKAIFDAAGFDLKSSETGCCGMAGTFGHELDNRALSKKIYDLHWRPIIDDVVSNETDSGKVTVPEQVLLATGFSCRCQVKRESAQNIMHPVQALLKALQP